MNKEIKFFLWLVAIFLIAYFLPLGNPKVKEAVLAAFNLLQWYAREHTLACVVPALFIAGAIVTFLSQQSVMKYLGPQASKPLAYIVGATSGTILAVCSCSVLPMFAGIYRLGAGLGPATAFLYAGPAINVLAIFLTARVLGLDIGASRAVGAIVFAILLGILMAGIFRKEEKAKAAVVMPDLPSSERSIGKTGLYFLCMILFLVFSDWYNPGDVVVTKGDGESFEAVVIQSMKDEIVFQQKSGVRISFPRDEVTVEKIETWVTAIHGIKWYLAAAMGIAVLLMVWRWFSRDEVKEWMANTWDFTKMLVPLLFGGVFIVGFLEKLIPQEYVARLVGDNGLASNLVASVIGAFMYFATLTEVPLTEALVKLGMSNGPVLALLLAGPALSLPNMLVIRSVMGWKKTVAFSVLVVIMATVSGIIFGWVAS